MIIPGAVVTVHEAGPGRVYQFGDDKTYEMHAYFQVSIDAPDGSKGPVIVGYDQSTVGIFENGEIAVSATLRGTQTGDNLFGGKTTEPLLIADVVDVATNSGTVS